MPVRSSRGSRKITAQKGSKSKRWLVIPSLLGILGAGYLATREGCLDDVVEDNPTTEVSYDSRNHRDIEGPDGAPTVSSAERLYDTSASDIEGPDGAPAAYSSEGTQEFYLDSDGDGFGNPDELIRDTVQPADYVDNNLDCDDYNPQVNPSVRERCNDKDDNCDGQVDEGHSLGEICDLSGSCENEGLTGISVCREDGNGDCILEEIANGADIVEVCDGRDNDCNGQIDESYACDNTQRSDLPREFVSEARDTARVTRDGEFFLHNDFPDDGVLSPIWNVEEETRPNIEADNHGIILENTANGTMRYHTSFSYGNRNAQDPAQASVRISTAGRTGRWQFDLNRASEISIAGLSLELQYKRDCLENRAEGESAGSIELSLRGSDGESVQIYELEAIHRPGRPTEEELGAGASYRREAMGNPDHSKHFVSYEGDLRLRRDGQGLWNIEYDSLEGQQGIVHQGVDSSQLGSPVVLEIQGTSIATNGCTDTQYLTVEVGDIFGTVLQGN